MWYGSNPAHTSTTGTPVHHDQHMNTPNYDNLEVPGKIKLSWNPLRNKSEEKQRSWVTVMYMVVDFNELINQ